MDHFKFVIKIYLTTLVFFSIGSIFFTPFLEAQRTDSDNLTTRILPLLKNPFLKNVSYGISIISGGKNVTLFNYHDEDFFRVASNMKLLTTAAALNYLGPDYTYKTSVEINGKIDAGELKGDVIIKGSGDPNLSGRFYDGNILAIPQYWADTIKRKGIYKISGDIVADDCIFDRVYVNPLWPKNQLSEWYCAPSCGLSFNDNCVDITIVPEKKPGNIVTLTVEPNTSYIEIFNTCVYTSNKKEHAYSIYRKPETNQVFIKGKFWVNASPQKNWVNVHNPALYLATVLKETMVKNGITVCGSARLVNERDVANAELEVVAQTISTMEQTVFVTNKRSQNFYAEQILKTLGAQIKGRGTLQAGLEVLQDFMNELGFSSLEYRIEDGSGLSKGNKLSPRSITTLLAYMNKHPGGKVFFDSLPVSGFDGGLSHRMTSPRYKNKIHAKTGYIANTSALSGYIDTSHGDKLIFSVLMNNFKNLNAIRKIQDDICRVLVDCYN